MNHKYALGLLLTMSVMSPLSQIRAAEPPNILLSEIAWAGSSKSTADEWIELRNVGSGNVDISGWSLAGIGTSGSAITIPTATSINAGSTYLIANYAITDSKTTLIVTPNLVTTAVSIPNTSLNVSLLDSGGSIIDSLVDPGTPNFGSSTTFSTMKRDLTSKNWLTESASANVSHISTVLDPVSSTSPDVTTISTAVDPASTTAPVIVTDPVPATDATSITATANTISPTESTSNSSPLPAEQPIVETVPVTTDQSTSTATIPIVDSSIMIAPVILETPVEASQPIIEAPIVEISSTEAVPIVIDPAIPDVVVLTPIATTPIVSSIVSIPVVTPPVMTSAPTSSAVATTSVQTPVVMTATPAATTAPTTTSSTATTVILPPSTSSVVIGDIVINEILPSPSTGNDEWVELKNMTSTSLSLVGLTLVDASGKITDLGGSIAANSYAVIANPNGNLNNDAETVLLMNGTTILDSVSYGTETNPAPKKDYALALVNGAWISQQSTPAASNVIATSSTVTAITASSTPSSETPTTAATTATSTTSAASIATSPSVPIIPTISPTLYANSTALVAAEQATNTASSSQSTSSGSASSSHSRNVAAAKSTASTAHPIALATASVKTASPTSPAAKSSATAKTTRAKASTKKKTTSTNASVRSISIDDIAAITDGTQVKLEGIVVAMPGVLGKRSFFIDGLEIYQSTGILAEVNVGDHISIIGEVSVLTDHQRINIKEGGVTTLDHTNPIVHDYESTLPYGSLVRITGTISARDGNAVLLKTDTATIKIVSGNGVNVAWANLAGAAVTVTGILKHGDQETLVLRSAEDIVKIENPDGVITATIAGTSDSSKTSLLWETAAFLAFASAGFGTWVWYSRPKAKLQKLTLHHNTV